MKEYFYIVEIPFVADSIEEEIEVELDSTSEWLALGIHPEKSKISFSSNICCLGYILYRILIKKKSFRDEKERNQKQIKIDKDSPYKF